MDEFLFPYNPYPIQVDFMKSVYQAIQDKKIGLFESPTGTGKSLSLFCASMKWLRDRKDDPLILDDEFKDSTKHKSKSEVPVWVREFQEKKAKEEEEWIKKEHHRVQSSYQSKLNRLRPTEDVEAPNAKRRKTFESFSSESHQLRSNYTKPSQDIDDYMVSDYESDEDKKLQDPLDDLSFGQSKPSLTSQADFKRKMIDEKKTEEELELEKYPPRKIFFCSRTHSQLSQFVQECSRTKWADGLRLVVLGSRKTMCINPEVNKLSSLNQMNDKCLDLISKTKPATGLSKEHQSKGNVIQVSFGNDTNRSNYSDEPLIKIGGSVQNHKITSTTGCSFFNNERQKSFRDNILAYPKDIEDLVGMGEIIQECPYFATRSAVQNAELVVLPYNTLLHKSTREALGIDLRGSVVILDEAHNIIDTVNSIYTVELSLSKISQAMSQLSNYSEKYKNRLKSKNMSYIEKLISMLTLLLKYLSPQTTSMSAVTASTSTTSTASTASSSTSTVPLTSSSSSSSSSNRSNDRDSSSHSCIVKLNDFLFDSRLDNHNIFKIDKYLQESDLIHKVQGFCTSNELEISIQRENRTFKIGVDENEFEKHRPALGQVAQFLMSLTNQGSDGCILKTINHHNPKLSSVKYILLNPEIHFQDILTQARSVILAGGTMQPFGDFSQHLLSNDSSSPKLDPSRVTTFTCSHIIPDENLTTLIFSNGPTGVEFNFTFEERNNLEALDELGRLVSNISNVTPDGIVLFSPSYQFEEKLISHWKTTGILDKLSLKKKLFREPKTTSSMDQILKDYADVIESNIGDPNQSVTGAILSCVVGGKLSEGINFKDGLGRCVIMIGLPFPNAKDPVLIEKLTHIEHKSKNNNKHSASSSAEYYENLCMKAVNQSIGRSIRHIGDYATIILVDKRYQKPSIQSKLPLWIRSRIRTIKHFGEGFRATAEFFLSKRPQQEKIQIERRNALK